MYTTLLIKNSCNNSRSIIRSSLFNNRRVVRFYGSGSSTTPLVEYKQQGDNKKGIIGYITLNNAKKRNALSLQMLNELLQELERVAQDKTLRVVILRSNGPIFSSGHDLKEIEEKKEDTTFHETLFSTCTKVMQAIRNLPQPVIAQVNGLATAAGCQLAATCDLIVATDKSSFATPGVKIGLFCSTPGVAVFRGMNSTKKTMEMLLTGDPITAQEALQYGLVNKVVKEEDLENETLKIAEKVAMAPSSIISMGKRAFYEQINQSVTGAYALTEKVMVDNLKKEDCKEGISAFVQKRHPNWK